VTHSAHLIGDFNRRGWDSSSGNSRSSPYIKPYPKASRERRTHLGSAVTHWSRYHNPTSNTGAATRVQDDKREDGYHRERPPTKAMPNSLQSGSAPRMRAASPSGAPVAPASTAARDAVQTGRIFLRIQYLSSTSTPHSWTVLAGAGPLCCDRKALLENV
jgi:hypothetical protein